MTKVNIISGFLGAGKTTLIKKLLKEAFVNEQVVLIENEFGEIGVDGGFMKEAGIEIKEMNSGCICCSLVGDFEESLKEVVNTYHPDRVIIEPSGVGKLSDIVKAVEKVHDDVHLHIDGALTVVDAKKVKMYQKNFGEFYNDQLEEAQVILMSHTQNVSQEKLEQAITLIREHNDHAKIVTTDWDKLDAEDILHLVDAEDWVFDMHEDHHHDHECCCHEHHHHDEECCCHEHHHHDEECCCHEHHHHEEECCCHEHHHHEEECCCHEHHHHDEECCCHEHHYHDEECCCHEHHHLDEDCCCHEHHHHHHADEVFETWGLETANAFKSETIKTVLDDLANSSQYGNVIRAKGIVETVDGTWLYFDVVPEEVEVREGKASHMSRICVIGTELDRERLHEVFK
ncbi:MAG: GTP-binding protein [Erysipelotrichaceae bacterium]|nr:GTP-binding protein [Erysipelotrichaceae bacterium]